MDAKTIEEQTAAYRAKLEAEMAAQVAAQERRLKEQAEREAAAKKAQAEKMAGVESFLATVVAEGEKLGLKFIMPKDAIMHNKRKIQTDAGAYLSIHVDDWYGNKRVPTWQIGDDNNWRNERRNSLTNTSDDKAAAMAVRINEKHNEIIRNKKADEERKAQEKSHEDARVAFVKRMEELGWYAGLAYGKITVKRDVTTTTSISMERVRGKFCMVDVNCIDESKMEAVVVAILNALE